MAVTVQVISLTDNNYSVCSPLPAFLLSSFRRIASWLRGTAVERQNGGLWPANYPFPARDLSLTGDHLCG